jgi:diguanylate cyclase (GGDEF)-like protein/PAS domain S-box-containing protein
MPDRRHPSRSEIAATAADLKAILDGLPAMIGYWDRDLRNRMANDAYVEFFGFTPEQMAGLHIREVLGEELYAKNVGYMRRALAGEPQLFDREIPTPSGELRYTQASYIPDVAEDGSVRGFFVLVTDITERRRAEEALAVAEARFRDLFTSAPIGMFLVDEGGLIAQMNPGGADLLGRPIADIVGHRVAEFTHPDDIAVSAEHLAALVRGDVEHYRLEKRYLRPDGEIVWAQLDATLLRGGAGTARMALGQVQDITDRRRHQAELEHLAHHDGLTGVLNRRGLAAELERQCADVARYGPSGVLLVIDLDGFKEVNDTCGHAVGDALLADVASIIRSRIRQTDVVGRLGGDEFAVILPRAGTAQAEALATSLLALLRQRDPGATGSRVTASIGTARFTADADPDLVLSRADLAMYRVKAAGGDGVAHHDAVAASSS